MNQPATLISILTDNPNSSAAINFVQGEHQIRRVTYAVLQHRAMGLLHHLQQSGIAQHDQIVLITQHNEAFLEGFWASILGSFTAVPLSFGISDEHKWKLFRILKQLDRPWIMLDHAHVVRIEKFAEKNGLQQEWTLLKDRLLIIEQIPNFTGQGTIVPAHEDQTAFIQFSSGTTSDPKGVVLSHKNLITNIRGIGEGIKISSNDATFSWMPLTHDMGLIGFHLTPLLFGIDQYIMPVELFIRRPLLWLQQISAPEVTITCSPNFGYQHCLNAWAAHQAESINLNHIRLMFNGAEPISVPLVNQFLKTFEPYGLKAETMFTVYGLAEASLAVAFPEAGQHFREITLNRQNLTSGELVSATEDGVSFVVEGKAVQGCQIRITAEDGRTLAPNTIGRIEIKGDNVTRGYLNSPEINQQMIHDGWLNTGDLGFLTASQELVVTGREKDIIFINGQNYYPHDLEMIAEEGLQIDKGKIAACGIRKSHDVQDQIILFVLHKGPEDGFPQQAAALKQVINERTGVEIAEVIPMTKLPKTTSGKIQRYLLGRKYVNGEFDEVVSRLRTYTMPSEEKQPKTAVSTIVKTLKSICDELIPEKQIRPDDNIFELGTTSLLLTQLYQRIDEVYPGKLEVTDFFDYPTLKQLANYIESKG